MKAGVEKAVGELRKAFAGHPMQVVESPCGGAYVLIEDVPLGGPFAQAAAKALIDNTQLTAREIVERSLNIAADICIYTNRNLVIEELK